MSDLSELRMSVLKYLEKNSRADFGEMAVLLDTDEAVIEKEVAEMEQEKIICGYHTLIDWERAGEEMVNALIEVNVTPQREHGFEKIAERISNFPEVSAVYLISGSYDILVTLEGKSLMEVSKFVSERLSPIEGVKNTATHFILKKYKDHGTVLIQKPKPERMPVTP